MLASNIELHKQQNNLPDAIIWLLGGTVAFVIAYLGATFIDSNGEYVFFGPDSFYHATRILTATNNLADFYQYDDRTDSWISWPWAYDFLLALLVKAICFFETDCNPVAILIHIPPFIVFLNAGLVLLIGIECKLTIFFKILLVACFAFSPLTQLLHLPGRIDHHMIEYSFILATVLLGMKWLRTGGTIYAISLGILLGSAPGFHNGLFIIQIPTIITFGLLWVKKLEPPTTYKKFILSFLLSACIVLIPSQSIWRFSFEFYYLSWFHFYVALCTALYCYLFSTLQFSIKNFFSLLALATVLLLPLIRQFILGLDFIGGDLPNYQEIGEIKSPLSYFPGYYAEYSFLLYLFPLFLGLVTYSLRYITTLERLYLTVFLIFGSTLLLAQRRMHYFGSLALYLPLLLFVNQLRFSAKSGVFAKYLAAGIFLTLCYYPSFSKLLTRQPLGMSFDYAVTAPIYQKMKESCDLRPGLVLADYSDGHYITYHSKCSIIANNMFVSSEDFRHVEKVQALLNMTIEELELTETDLDYIYVRREDNIFLNNGIEDIKISNKGLRYELLIDRSNIPENWELIAELIDEKLTYPVIAAFYRVNKFNTPLEL